MMETDIHEATTRIVAAYVGKNALRPEDLPALIFRVSETIERLLSPAEPEELPQEPAVPIKRSINPDHLLCLECGRKSRLLRRHLRVAHGLSPEHYRRKWKLLPDYPMTAPGYAKIRAEMAVASGFAGRGNTNVVPLNSSNET